VDVPGVAFGGPGLRAQVSAALHAGIRGPSPAPAGDHLRGRGRPLRRGRGRPAALPPGFRIRHGGAGFSRPGSGGSRCRGPPGPSPVLRDALSGRGDRRPGRSVLPDPGPAPAPGRAACRLHRSRGRLSGLGVPGAGCGRCRQAGDAADRGGGRGEPGTLRPTRTAGIPGFPGSRDALFRGSGPRCGPPRGRAHLPHGPGATSTRSGSDPGAGVRVVQPGFPVGIAGSSFPPWNCRSAGPHRCPPERPPARSTPITRPSAPPPPGAGPGRPRAGRWPLRPCPSWPWGCWPPGDPVRHALLGGPRPCASDCRAGSEWPLPWTCGWRNVWGRTSVAWTGAAWGSPWPVKGRPPGTSTTWPAWPTSWTPGASPPPGQPTRAAPTWPGAWWTWWPRFRSFRLPPDPLGAPAPFLAGWSP